MRSGAGTVTATEISAKRMSSLPRSWGPVISDGIETRIPVVSRPQAGGLIRVWKHDNIVDPTDAIQWLIRLARTTTPGDASGRPMSFVRAQMTVSEQYELKRESGRNPQGFRPIFGRIVQRS